MPPRYRLLDLASSGRGASAEKRWDYARFYFGVNVLTRQRPRRFDPIVAPLGQIPGAEPDGPFRNGAGCPKWRLAGPPRNVPGEPLVYHDRRRGGSAEGDRRRRPRG